MPTKNCKPLRAPVVPAQGWIAAKDRRPSDLVRVLGYWSSGATALVYWSESRGEWAGHIPGAPTHWCSVDLPMYGPLAAAPVSRPEPDLSWRNDLGGDQGDSRG